MERLGGHMLDLSTFDLWVPTVLNRAPILIVEDEPFIALELQLSVEHAGGEVVGPVATAGAVTCSRIFGPPIS